MPKVAAMRPVAVLVALGVLVTACGSGPAHDGVASVGKAKAGVQLLKYSVCMRSHGVTNFPGPRPIAGGGFGFPAGAVPDPNTPQSQSAAKACQKDLGPSFTNLTPAKMTASAARWVKCLRSHGEPDFPEPEPNGVIYITMTPSMSPNAPQLQRASDACQSADNVNFSIEWSSSTGPSS